MRDRRFYHLSGAGNDFLALVGGEATPTSATIAAWCRRGVSLGADGLFVLHHQGPGTVRMDYFNADGLPADLCLNGTRCAARLASELGWVRPGSSGAVTILTGAGTIEARRTGAEEAEIEIAPPGPARRLTLEAAGRTWGADFVAVGVPHLVVPWTEPLGEAPVVEAGAPLRRHRDLGPAGANVNFVRFVGPHRFEIRTFERGVEAETLACGTGVVAAVQSGLERAELRLPVEALTAGGFRLAVRTAAGGRWGLRGDARLVAWGEIGAAASAGPEPPTWTP